MNENTIKANELLANKSIIVNHSDVETFVEAFNALGLNPKGGADLGEMGRVLYF
jgi:hypothetical protein